MINKFNFKSILIVISSPSGAGKTSLANAIVEENKNIFQELGSEWNYMPFLQNSKKLAKPNFFHFVGISGKQIINRLQDNKIDILDFLQEIKK